MPVKKPEDELSLRVGHYVTAHAGKHTYIEYRGTVHVANGETLDAANQRLIDNTLTGLLEATESYIESREIHGTAKKGIRS